MGTQGGLLERLKSDVLVFDGAMGTMLFPGGAGARSLSRAVECRSARMSFSPFTGPTSTPAATWWRRIASAGHA